MSRKPNVDLENPFQKSNVLSRSPTRVTNASSAKTDAKQSVIQPEKISENKGDDLKAANAALMNSHKLNMQLQKMIEFLEERVKSL